MKSRPLLVVFVCLLLVSPLLAATADYDDCDARFVAAIGTNAYQFSPLLKGDLGTVKLYSILSYQRTAAMKRFGRAFWEVDVVGPENDARLVLHADGVARIDARGAALAEVWWDGRDINGTLVDPGLYHYTFRARFVRDAAPASRPLMRYEDVRDFDPEDEAIASVGEVVIDYALDAQASLTIRTDVATSCQIQQNTPIETGFGYNFYYGSTHSHSNFSDGGQPLTGCSSGNAYGSGTFDPAAVFNYARNTAGLDYWIVNEHNHLINDALATNGTVSEANVKARYQTGLTAAANATVSGSFIGLYGMEWGVLTNADQGHVTLIDTPKLFGWETCSTCTGATAECTPGTNCYFDIYTPKRFAYLTMYQRSVENPSPAAGAPLGILCHPSSGQFDNFAFNANADAALQGIAVRSGLAFNTANNCATANVGATDYVPQWNNALALGFHLAPSADHDAHCDNYGSGLPTRTVYLLPNGVSPALTKAALLAAHKARHFFASEDSNAQIVFATSDGAHVMGDIFTAGASVTLRGAAYDPNGEGVSRIELWRGQIGAAAPTAAYKTFTSVSSFTSAESAASGTQFWYYMRVVQADGNNIWSAPMWITYGGSTCTDTTAPAVSIAAPANGATLSCTATTIQVSASDAAGIASAQLSIDGGAWQAASFNSTSGKYELSWTPAAGSHTINARATDASCNANVGSAAQISVTASCGTTTTQILLNPGFDSGNVNWTATAGVITNSTGETPHGGAWYAWLDGYGTAHTDSLYQTVSIPAGAAAATLKFYLHIDTAETTTTTAYDTLKVQIRNTSNTVLATLATYSNLNATTGYTIKQFDLLAYKGQTIRVYFLGVEDSSLQTSFVIDTTSLNVTQ